MLLRRADGNKVWLMKNRFTAIIERGEKYLIATCAKVPEDAGQGKTRAAALRDLSASIQSVLDFRREEALAKAASDADQEKVAMARRLREEPVMTVAWIGQRLKMGSRHTVANSLKLK